MSRISQNRLRTVEPSTDTMATLDLRVVVVTRAMCSPLSLVSYASPPPEIHIDWDYKVTVQCSGDRKNEISAEGTTTAMDGGLVRLRACIPTIVVLRAQKVGEFYSSSNLRYESLILLQNLPAPDLTYWHSRLPGSSTTGSRRPLNLMVSALPPRPKELEVVTPMAAGVDSRPLGVHAFQLDVHCPLME